MFKPRKVWSDYGRRDLAEGRGNCLKYLKRGGTEKRGGETKFLKRRRQAESRGECLKKKGLETPYELWLTNVIFSEIFWRDK